MLCYSQILNMDNNDMNDIVIMYIFPEFFMTILNMNSITFEGKMNLKPETGSGGWIGKWI